MWPERVEARVASRDFIDSAGVAWRAWNVTPETMHPRTAAEDFLADLQDGWLVFETIDGERKRRLCPYPTDWAERSRSELEALLERATPVQRRPARRPAPEAPGTRLSESAAGVSATSEEASRTFTSPSGRRWEVAPVQLPGGETVLRFTTEGLALDLDRWPRDWREYDEMELAQLVLDAHPPRRESPEEPRRRPDDVQP